MNEALRDWVTNIRTTYYLIGSVAGPHPYPMMVRDFQSVIGRETRRQILKKEGRLPDFLVACVGGGSNAMGLFYPFKDDPGVKMVGVEAGGSRPFHLKNMPPQSAGAKSAFFTEAKVICSRMNTARSKRFTLLPRGWTIPA